MYFYSILYAYSHKTFRHHHQPCCPKCTDNCVQIQFIKGKKKSAEKEQTPLSNHAQPSDI